MKDVYASEDLPEEWIDGRKILKPIFNAARRQESLRKKTKLVKDRLVIDGKTYTVAPENNLAELNQILDVTTTCQKTDTNIGVTVYLGSHSPFSNLYQCNLTIKKC